MSTIPEVTVTLSKMGVKVFSISLITNTEYPGKIVQTSHEKFKEVAQGKVQKE